MVLCGEAPNYVELSVKKSLEGIAHPADSSTGAPPGRAPLALAMLDFMVYPEFINQAGELGMEL